MPELAEVEEVNRKAFVSKPYSNKDKIEEEEKELEQLLAEQKGESAEQEAETETEPTSAEEKTFKKRYGDLRRHTQKQQDDLQNKVKALESQLEAATKEQIKLPKTEKEIDEWAKQYPDVAGIIETIAIKKANEQSESLKKRLREIDDMHLNASKDKAEAQLMQIHPDFEDIRNDDKFHEWAEEQPKWIQNALYENDSDAHAAARAIDLYKNDVGIVKPKESKTSKSNNKDAAMAVTERSQRNAPPVDNNNASFTESEVERMSAKDYEKNADAIMEAIRSGKFVYDLTGSAR